MGFRGAYDIQNFLVLVSWGLLLIDVNMHYAKFTLWTPKLQTLAKSLCVTHNNKMMIHLVWSIIVPKLFEIPGKKTWKDL